MREMKYSDALNEALRQCMIEDERVVVLGEDIGCYGGIFQVTKGLQIAIFIPYRITRISP